MNTESENEVFDAWYASIRENDIDGALLIAANAYSRAAAANSTDSRALFGRLLRLSAGGVGRQRSGGDELVTSVCSFCCEPIGTKKVVRGPRTAICEKCIKLAVELIGD